MEPLDPLAKAAKWKIVTTGEGTLPSRDREGAELHAASQKQHEPSPTSGEPGEFTRLFQAPAGTAPGADPPTSDTMPERPSDAAAAGPGEFTRFFGGPLQQRSPAASPHSGEPDRDPTPERSLPATPETGEFTWIFHRPFQPPPQEPPSVEPRLPEPQAAVSHTPEGFTEIFGPTPSFPPGAKSEAECATQVFKTPGSVSGAPQQASSQGPGEYTRIIRPSANVDMQNQQPSAPKPVSPAASSPSKPVSYLPLVLALSVLFLLAVGLVLYFAFRR